MWQIKSFAAGNGVTYQIDDPLHRVYYFSWDRAEEKLHRFQKEMTVDRRLGTN